MKKRKLQFDIYKPDGSPLPPVYVTYMVGRGVWILMADYKLVVSANKQEVTFLIPTGFEFDLASIPRGIWPIIGSFELSIVAPLIHDLLYRFKGGGMIFGGRMTRAEADRLFYDLMIMEGVAKWKANAAYRAVQIFASRW